MSSTSILTHGHVRITHKITIKRALKESEFNMRMAYAFFKGRLRYNLNRVMRMYGFFEHMGFEID